MGGVMSSVVISGDTSGAITVAVPAVAGTNTVTIAAQTGTLNAAGPAFSANLATDQSVTSSTWTKARLNNEQFDTNNNFDSSTNYRFTPTVAGYYQINGVINTAVSGAATRTICAIYKNGSEYLRGGDVSGVASTVSAVISFNGSTDYVEFYGWVASVTTPAFTSGAQSGFSGSLVRGA